MLRALTISSFGAISAVIGCSAAADEFVVPCGQYFVNLSKSTTVLGGVERTVIIDELAEKDRSFMIRISPSDGLSAEDAFRAAVLQTDIVCMHLEAHARPTKFVEQSDETFVFWGGCEGHRDRLGGSCQ